MKICSKTHQIAPFKKKYREACPRTHLTNSWLRHASQAVSRHATRPAPQKVDPLGKSCIRPWTVTKKNIPGDALIESTLADS